METPNEEHKKKYTYGQLKDSELNNNYMITIPVFN